MSQIKKNTKNGICNYGNGIGYTYYGDFHP